MQPLPARIVGLFDDVGSKLPAVVCTKPSLVGVSISSNCRPGESSHNDTRATCGNRSDHRCASLTES